IASRRCFVARRTTSRASASSRAPPLSICRFLIAAVRRRSVARRTLSPLFIACVRSVRNCSHRDIGYTLRLGPKQYPGLGCLLFGGNGFTLALYTGFLVVFPLANFRKHSSFFTLLLK